jgi:hypothetical protein
MKNTPAKYLRWSESDSTSWDVAKLHEMLVLSALMELSKKIHGRFTVLEWPVGQIFVPEQKKNVALYCRKQKIFPAKYFKSPLIPTLGCGQQVTAIYVALKSLRIIGFISHYSDMVTYVTLAHSITFLLSCFRNAIAFHNRWNEERDKIIKIRVKEQTSSFLLHAFSLFHV